MAIFEMYEDPKTGELHVVLGDRVVAISSVDGGPFATSKHIERVVSNHGKDDPLGINIRTTFQTDRLLPASKICEDPTKVAQLKAIVVSYRDRLLMMFDCFLHIDKEIMRCNEEFKYIEGNMQLPQVDQLQETVESFLLHGKKALRELSKIFPIFFGQSFKEDHRYTALRDKAKLELGKDHSVTKVLEYNLDGDEWPKNLVEMRNRVEHDSEHTWLKIRNITFDSSSKKMIAPSWATDLQPSFSDIRTDMQVFLNNVLVMSEDLVATCILETRSTSIITVGSIPPDKIDPELPLRWGIFVEKLPQPDVGQTSPAS